MLKVNSKIRSLAKFSSEKYCRVPIENTKGLIRLLCFEAGQSVVLHTHPTSDECFLVVEGNGKITVGREERDAESGSFVRVPAGVTHQWRNGSHRLILLSILIPTSAYDLASEAAEQKLVC
jgi:quercetin dioxygenase-like cupin family protein